MNMKILLTLLSLILVGCNTVEASKGDTTTDRVMEGVKKDAKATGDAIGKVFKRDDK
jgi:hypothetical protein